MSCLLRHIGECFLLLCLLGVISLVLPALSLADDRREDLKDSPREPRNSTFAAKKTDPKLGRKQSTTLARSNPYEARKAQMIRDQENYQAALLKWQRKVELAEHRAMIKKQREDEKRLAKLRKEQEKKLAKESRYAQKQDGAFQSLGLLFGSRKGTSDSSAKLTKTTPPAGQEPLFNDNKPSTVNVAGTEGVQEEPSFFQRLKWALFGK